MLSNSFSRRVWFVGGRGVLLALFFGMTFLWCDRAAGQAVHDFGAWFSVNTQGKFKNRDFGGGLTGTFVILMIRMGSIKASFVQALVIN